MAKQKTKFLYSVKWWSLIDQSFVTYGWFWRKKVGYVFSPSGIYLNHSLSLSDNHSCLFHLCFSSCFLPTFFPCSRFVFISLSLSLPVFSNTYASILFSLCLSFYSICFKLTVQQYNDIPLEKNWNEREKGKNFPQIYC